MVMRIIIWLWFLRFCIWFSLVVNFTIIIISRVFLATLVPGWTTFEPEMAFFDLLGSRLIVLGSLLVEPPSPFPAFETLKCTKNWSWEKKYCSQLDLSSKIQANDITDRLSFPSFYCQISCLCMVELIF